MAFVQRATMYLGRIRNGYARWNLPVYTPG
jgi:hypothetical protein